MFFSKAFRLSMLFFLLNFCITNRLLFAYDGHETWLHYTAVPDTLQAQYQSVCQSLVLCDTLDTMKNAQYEFDLAIPKLLGGSTLPIADGPGAIVLAPEGSDFIPESIGFDDVNNEGFIIKSSDGKTYITGKSQIGVLYGVFHFLRLMQTAEPIDNLDIVENPYFPFRVLDHWYNHYSSHPETERVYGGGRHIRLEELPDFRDKQRIIDYCRMATSLGLNGICPDNVNTYRGGSIGNYKCLEVSNLKTQKVFADILGTYGLKYYLSVSYASPRLVNPKISTADAFHYDEAKQWWFDKVDTVRAYIKNFGGFLMKADSEGEEGPGTTYQMNQSQGANPMAEALQRYGHTLIWRTFIYDSMDPDFAVCQSMEFENQTWEPGVILRTKDGPRDFQVIEPPNQVLSMPGVRHGMEFQITQEYTGQAIHLCWLVPRWKKILDYDYQMSSVPEGTEGSIAHQLLRGTGEATTGGGVWAISNFSDTINWTAHFLAQANSYGYGRLVWNPMLSSRQIADEWVKCSFDNGNDRAVSFIVWDMLHKSWKTYEGYTISYSALMPALENDNHYEISFLGMQNSRFFTEYFMNLQPDGIGVDRTSTTGNNMVRYYPTALRNLFENISICPEEYILFFHHLPWEYEMKSGMTLIQSLFYLHYKALRNVRNFINNWKLLNTVTTIDSDIYSHILSKLTLQLSEARRWVNTFENDFGTYYKTAVPCNLAIITPDENEAVTLDVGSSVDLSIKFTDQFGDAVSGAINWNVDRDGGTFSSNEGISTSFSANTDGIYTITASHSTIPDISEEIQIFVGDWPNWLRTGIKTNKIFRPAKFTMKIMQRARHIVIMKPFIGKVDIFRLQGSLVKSFPVNSPKVCLWDTKGIAKGVYLIRLKNEKQRTHKKFIIK